MRIKKGDTVKMLAGRDRGKTGKVLRAFPDRQAVTVEGVNLLMKHLRPRRQGERGQRVRFPAPLPVARVMLVCPKCGKPTRVGMRPLTDGRKERECKECQQTFT